MLTSPAFVEPPLESLVDGEWLSASGRRCFRVLRQYPLASYHGSQWLGDITVAEPACWARVVAGNASEAFCLEHAAFIDTETTGIARESGTYCFLVGIGTVEGEVVSVRQYFMPDFGDEDALLDFVSADLGRCPALVSFNGRAFDWPLLETRFVLSRRRMPHPGEPHLDLLPLARRIWRRTMPSCALAVLEREVLGVTRTDEDIPGWVIPQLYLDYVQMGRTRPMAGVFYHNAMDVLSMVALAARIGRILSAEDSSEVADAISLARLHARYGDAPRAEGAYRAALACSPRPDATLAARELSGLLKRAGRVSEAMDLWWGELEKDVVYPYVELAKQCEHRLKDYATALALTRRAIERVTGGYLIPRAPEESVTALQHRLARLERALGRKASPSSEPSG